jgi:hypothetical protein
MIRFEKLILALAVILAVAMAATTGNYLGFGLLLFFFPLEKEMLARLNAPGAELLKRYFTTEIQPKLFPSNSFLNRALDDDAFVNNNTVELAHSGTLPDAPVDRAVLPAAIVSRTDVPTNYQLEELTTDPVKIGYSEEVTINYAKRQSILDQKAEIINKKAANRILYKWAAGAANFIPTVGAARNATGPAQTGTRKRLTLDAFYEVKERFHKDDIILENQAVNGIALLTPAQMSDLLRLDEVKDALRYGSANLPEGVVGRLLGFDLMVRSSVLALNAADALKAEGAAGATTDQDAAFFWSPSFVRRAKGAIVPFIDLDKPEYYGSLFSMLVRIGGIPARNDNKGTYIVFEDNV